MRLKFPLPSYTLLRAHNIARRKLCLLFLNIVKMGKWRETQNCPNSGFFYNFCHWLSEKSIQFKVWYFRVAHFESNWRYAFTHYVTIIQALIDFGSQTSSFITWEREAKFLRSKFCKFFSLIEIWGWWTHFSVTNLLSI